MTGYIDSSVSNNSRAKLQQSRDITYQFSSRNTRNQETFIEISISHSDISQQEDEMLSHGMIRTTYRNFHKDMKRTMIKKNTGV